MKNKMYICKLSSLKNEYKLPLSFMAHYNNTSEYYVSNSNYVRPLYLLVDNDNFYNNKLLQSYRFHNITDRSINAYKYDGLNSMEKDVVDSDRKLFIERMVRKK